MRIGLVLNVLDEEYQISVYKGVYKRALELGIQVICFQLENVMFEQKTLTSTFPGQDFFNLDGIILLTSVIVDGYALKQKQEIQKLWGNIPVVSVGQKIQDIPSLLIETDDSMKSLVEHLIIKHKYRHFLYIGGSQNHHDADQREQIFKDTLEAYKPWFSDISYSVKRGWFKEHEATQIMAEFYNQNPDEKIDVVVCANDNMAIGVYKFFKGNYNNNKIQECAVTGFDDIPQSRYVIPSLTTVRQPLEEIGFEALDTLLKIIDGKDVKLETYIESELVIRESCGCTEKKSESSLSKDNIQPFIQKLQTNYVQTEQLLRLVSHIGQDLNYSDTESSLITQLNANMEQLEIQNFCVFSFKDFIDKSSAVDINKLYVRPIFIRKSGKCLYDLDEKSFMHLNEIYSKFICSDIQTINSITFNFLTSGNSIVGCIFYEAPFNVLPYLCSISVSITQSIIHINSLEERIKRSEYLEREIAKRTKELIDVNEKRMQVEAEVLKISELERQRFSTDLHDDICQRLAGISMLCRSYSNQDDGIEKEQMEELAQLISDTLQTTRQYAHNSYPVELESLGLNHSISNLCNSYSVQSQIPIEYEWNIIKDIKLTNIQKLNIFRIIQEALHNILKHAQASKVYVTVSMINSVFEVKIQDDGLGIKLNKIKRGLGINSMEYRANQIGASFNIKSIKPHGTLVSVKFKVK